MQQQAQSSKIDLTPMLDVVFIMLIFFVVTATFVIEQGIDVNSQSDEQLPPPIEPKTKAILVNITSNNRFVVNGETVDVRLLRPQFEQLNAQDPEAPVIVNPHADSSTDSLVRVMDSAAAAGIADLKFAQQSK